MIHPDIKEPSSTSPNLDHCLFHSVLFATAQPQLIPKTLQHLHFHASISASCSILEHLSSSGLLSVLLTVCPHRYNLSISNDYYVRFSTSSAIIFYTHFLLSSCNLQLPQLSCISTTSSKPTLFLLLPHSTSQYLPPNIVPTYLALTTYITPATVRFTLPDHLQTLFT